LEVLFEPIQQNATTQRVSKETAQITIRRAHLAVISVSGTEIHATAGLCRLQQARTLDRKELRMQG
jgi:hypothetical protein